MTSPQTDKTKKSLRQLKTIFHNAIVLDGLIRDLGMTPWAVYTIIAIYANWHTGISWPSQMTIMDLTGIKSRNRVKRGVARLVDAGYLSDDYRHPLTVDGVPYGHKRHFYTLTWPAESEYIKP